MAHVGVVFSFRVAPKDDAVVEGIMREIFDAMALEEFPSGDVLTYTLFRDPAEPGKWVMFEYFTQAGSERHSAGPLMLERGRRLVERMIGPYERILLDPVIALGCGEPIPRERP